MPTNLLALLPELILALTGVLVMLAEPLIAPGRTRKPLGWLAILGTTASGLAALYQLHVVDTLRPSTGILSTLPASGQLTAFSGTIQISAFSVFFHLLIASIVLVTLLASLDYFEDPITHAGEYFALVCFGATGMMFMTSSVELLMVFNCLPPNHCEVRLQIAPAPQRYPQTPSSRPERAAHSGETPVLALAPQPQPIHKEVR